MRQYAVWYMQLYWMINVLYREWCFPYEVSDKISILFSVNIYEKKFGLIHSRVMYMSFWFYAMKMHVFHYFTCILHAISRSTFILNYICMFTWLQGTWRPEEDIRWSPETGAASDYELAHRSWELNSGPLQEQ